jgi:hypothetical protein
MADKEEEKHGKGHHRGVISKIHRFGLDLILNNADESAEYL